MFEVFIKRINSSHVSHNSPYQSGKSSQSTWRLIYYRWIHQGCWIHRDNVDRFTDVDTSVLQNNTAQRHSRVHKKHFYSDFVHLASLFDLTYLTYFGWLKHNQMLRKLKLLSSEVLMTFCHKFVLDKMLDHVVQHRWIHRARLIHRDTNLCGSTAFSRLVVRMLIMDLAINHVWNFFCQRSWIHDLTHVTQPQKC